MGLLWRGGKISPGFALRCRGSEARLFAMIVVPGRESLYNDVSGVLENMSRACLRREIRQQGQKYKGFNINIVDQPITLHCRRS